MFFDFLDEINIWQRATIIFNNSGNKVITFIDWSNKYDILFDLNHIDFSRFAPIGTHTFLNVPKIGHDVLIFDDHRSKLSWERAKIINVLGDQILIKYEKYSSKFNEFIFLSSNRIYTYKFNEDATECDTTWFRYLIKNELKE